MGTFTWGRWVSLTGSMFKGLSTNDSTASFEENVLLVRISRRNQSDKFITFASIYIWVMSLQSVGSNVMCLSWRCGFSWQIEFSTTCQSECMKMRMDNLVSDHLSDFTLWFFFLFFFFFGAPQKKKEEKLQVYQSGAKKCGSSPS